MSVNHVLKAVSRHADYKRSSLSVNSTVSCLVPSVPCISGYICVRTRKVSRVLGSVVSCQAMKISSGFKPDDV